MKTMSDVFAEQCGVGAKYDVAMHFYIQPDEDYAMCDECGQEVCECGGMWKVNVHSVMVMN